MNQNEQQEEKVFEAVLKLPKEKRAGYLENACAGNPELRQRLEMLLGAHERARDFLQEPAMPREGTLDVSFPPTARPGDKIGRYKLLQEIGEGGCGIVYMAQQEEPVHRRVALKIIKLGMDTKEVVARFEAERQALALMDHPNIAKVLDAGATETGRPFFVMELVRGIKITEYCDQERIPTRERLTLFVQICHAIQHAHQKGIIHRDIKPSNILVTLHDGIAIPKVIDFGIAKATTDMQLTDKTMYTRFEQFIGTPAYMSPEQAEMSGLDVDTRTDIYSLGVLCYELLTGQTPFDAKELQAAGIEAIRRTIREKEPARPSTRVGTLKGNDLTTTANRRGLDPPKLMGMLRGDLDWIVMKALEKDRSRRYETANGLAMDVERHLKNEPVIARPPSKIYRFKKSVQRNKPLYAAGVAIGLALLAGAIVSLWQANQAARERDAAARAKQQAEALNHFLTEDLLYQAIPDRNPRERSITLEEAVKAAAKGLEQKSNFPPEIEASLRLSVGTTCFMLGYFDEAERHLQRAVFIRKRMLGPAAAQTLAANEALAKLLSEGRRKFTAAATLGRETWEGRRRLLGREHPDTLESMGTFATALAQDRKFEVAEPLLRQCLEAKERVLGTEQPSTLATLSDLALLLMMRGDLSQAEKVFRDVIERRIRAGLEKTIDTIAAKFNLGLTLLFEGRTEDAAKLLSELREEAQAFFGAEHPYTLHIQHTLVRAFADAGDLDQAEKLGLATLEARRRVTPGAEGTSRTLLYLGYVLVQKGKLDQAEPLLREAVEISRGPDVNVPPYFSLWATNWLGAIKLARKSLPEAETLLLPSAGPILAAAELSPNERRLAIGHIVSLYESLGKTEEAAKWKSKLESVSQIR